MGLASIEVYKKSVRGLLKTGSDNKFLIPEYQRPYAWEEDEIRTLFEDIVEFTENETSKNDGELGTYFLGSIVSYINEDGEQEIIDGQQRITSLFLLLRAIYTKLNNLETKTKPDNNFLNQIGSAIWKKDRITGDIDYSNILIYSKVMNNEGNEIFKHILQTGEADHKSKDNYSKNYLLFGELFNKLSEKSPNLIHEFIDSLLNKAILLPIQADNQDTALTIFSTLNDRGKPLSDSDIFKAKMYNKLTQDEKKIFIEKWKYLNERAEYCGESIQQLFYYYMFYLRAIEKDNKTATPGIRKFYSYNKFERLSDKKLLEELDIILNLWEVVNNNKNIEESWSENVDIVKILNQLSSYPNEFWKYPVVIYYLCHRNDENFDKLFLFFLRKLYVELCTKYIVTPTINAVKGDIIKLNNEIVDSMIPAFNFKKIDQEILKDRIIDCNSKSVRMLLKTLAYNHQDEILPEKWEIEHILPKKWDDHYFPQDSEETVSNLIEHLGNKIPFEKKLNIKASNGFFSKKKENYKVSGIQITKKLSQSNTKEWKLESIRERDIEVRNELLNIFDSWNKDYSKLTNTDNKDVPSEEDLARIEEYRRRGFI